MAHWPALNLPNVFALKAGCYARNSASDCGREKFALKGFAASISETTRKCFSPKKCLRVGRDDTKAFGEAKPQWPSMDKDSRVLCLTV